MFKWKQSKLLLGVAHNSRPWTLRVLPILLQEIICAKYSNSSNLVVWVGPTPMFYMFCICFFVLWVMRYERKSSPTRNVEVGFITPKTMQNPATSPDFWPRLKVNPALGITVPLLQPHATPIWRPELLLLDFVASCDPCLTWWNGTLKDPGQGQETTIRLIRLWSCFSVPYHAIYHTLKMISLNVQCTIEFSQIIDLSVCEILEVLDLSPYTQIMYDLPPSSFRSSGKKEAAPRAAWPKLILTSYSTCSWSWVTMQVPGRIRYHI